MPEDKPIIGPLSVESVPWEEWSHGERYGGRVRALTNAGGGSHVGVSIEELPPGKKSCPAHYHHLEEEHMLILDGQATLRLGDKTYEIKAGDYVCFPAGQTAGHCLVNNSDTTCRFLMIGERNPHEVCIYPDSNKVFVRAVPADFRLDAAVDYWDGEE